MTDSSSPTARRRAVLAAVAGGATALSSGCLRRVRNFAGWQSPRRLQFQIKTLPADADPYALRLARTLAEWYRAAGIGVDVVPMAEQELLRQTLLRNEFDLFVMRLPAQFRDPDALYTLLHSTYAEAPGWQNPFGYADLDVDELLETQRRTAGSVRRDALTRLQTTVAAAQPFSILAVPDDIRAARTTAYAGWRSADLRSPLGYLSLWRADGRDAGPDDALRLAVTDRRSTTNLNPLAVEFRRDGILTGLLYDPLGYPADGDVRPWLADSWAFSARENATARVSLREGLTWHDGEALTASDVVFTNELLADTTLGSDDAANDASVPSPRFQGRNSLVTGATAVDETTVEFQFGDIDPNVAVRAFTVPVLPEHVWSERTGSASLGGIDVGPVTEALVTDNIPPVGSGPLRFVQNTPRERLVLERFDDHFLASEAPGGHLAARIGSVPFERLSVHVVGSDVTAVELVASGEADVTGTTVNASTVPRIGRADDLELLIESADSPYVVGYNTRQPHLNNPRFRAILARLIDGEYLARTVLDGYGRPAAGVLWGTPWYPEELEWDDGDPVNPFFGTDGEVDVGRAREAIRDAGYHYDDGSIVDRNP